MTVSTSNINPPRKMKKQGLQQSQGEGQPNLRYGESTVVLRFLGSKMVGL